MNIIQYPDPILSQKAAPVIRFDKSLKRLARQMIDTMRANGGCGLAAPQVGESIRMFVIETYPGNSSMIWPDQRIFINPIVKFVGFDTMVGPEGCFSIPRVSLALARAVRVDGTAKSG